MAWPTTKAGTTNVDQGTDSISLARPDIKQNIDNVNNIIDEFNISSPSTGDTLVYDGSVWQPKIAPNVNVVEQDSAYDAPSGGANSEADYSSTFTLSGNGGLTTTSNYVTFPAGTYIIQSIGVQNITGSPIDATDRVETRLRTDDVAEDLIAYADSEVTGITAAPLTYRYIFGFGVVYTFASDTNVKLTFEVFENGADDTYTINPIRVERIA
jgi:hypothetical protein